jgi:hypothetical protein
LNHWPLLKSDLDVQHLPKIVSDKEKSFIDTCWQAKAADSMVQPKLQTVPHWLSILTWKKTEKD